MPINVYTGLMRSGKSYEVVSQVIINAIAQGRRVVTNVDGISNELIREYVAQKQKLDIEKLGVVSHVQNEDIFKPDFFPYFDDYHGEHTDTFVQPGDLVCVDEAWRFWGSDCKLHKHHKSFFLEHGHFTHPETHVACDLVLMIQDMGTLHRFVKNVVAFSFRTHKKVSLGMGSTYSVTMWEGSKQTRSTEIGNWVRRYQKEIFALYSSFKGGAEGKTVNVDSRQNILANKRLWFIMIACVVVGFFSVRNIWRFFNPVDTKPKPPVAVSVSVPGAVGGVVAGPSVSAPVFSSNWRYVGELRSGSMAYAIVASENGRLRLESPSVFTGRGLVAVGKVDGHLVTSFSGRAAPPGGFLGASANPAPSPAPAGPPVGSSASVSPFAGDQKK